MSLFGKMEILQNPENISDFIHTSIQLLHKYRWIYQFKMTDILFPSNIANIPAIFLQFFEESDRKSLENFQNLLLRQAVHQCPDHWPEEISTFIEAFLQCNLIVGSQLYEKSTTETPNSVPKKWSKKKFEEVVHLSNFVREISSSTECDAIVDIGSGLGYLSSHLAEICGVPVIAVESHEGMVQSALASKSDLVQYVNLELNSNILKQLSPCLAKYSRVCITGLHACGNLTPWSLKFFLEDPRCLCLAIIPCCYHKMNRDSYQNIPLSNTLKSGLSLLPVMEGHDNDGVGLVRTEAFCRLATQRTAEDFAVDLENETKHVFYRGLLELYAKQANIEIRNNRRRGMKGDLGTFDEYIAKAIGHNGKFTLEGDFELHKQNLVRLCEEKDYLRSIVTALILMQGSLQNIAEKLIMLDRLQFLVENGNVEVGWHRIIPQSVSQRGLVVVARKVSKTLMKLVRFGFLILRREFHKLRLENFKVETKEKASGQLRDLLVNMPKEQVHIPLLKSARKQKREGVTKFPAGFITLEVLGNGSKGSPSSLYVFTDQTRYLFNCGEGTQRLAHEHKMKLAKLEHVFITTKQWSRIGGLPGIALTVQDIGVPSLTLHGPHGLEHLFEATRRFVVLRDLNIHVSNCVDGSFAYFEDHIMRVDYVPLLRRKNQSEPSELPAKSSSSENSSPEEDNVDYYKPLKGFKRHLDITHDESEANDSDSKKTKLEFTIGEHLEEHIICFICKPKEKPGALEISKCVALGVPAGPLLGKLKAGEDVVLPNGNVVKADDVRSADCPGPIFIVVDCPNEDYLDSLVECTTFAEYQSAATREDHVAKIVVHFTPRDILLNPKYVDWMKKFRSSTQHILINELCEGMGSEAVHRLQHKLNILDSSMFPVLNETAPYTKSEVNDGEQVLQQIPEPLSLLDLPYIMGRTLLKYGLRPLTGLDKTAMVPIDAKEYVNEAMKMPDFPDTLKKLKSGFLKLGQTNNEVREYPRITFLGTGSCIPNKTRNTSGILIDINEESSMIMDCGEGTYGQIVRFFGNDESDRVMMRLKAIYVSHLHADHHLGLINLLQARALAFKELNVPLQRIFLIAPQQITTWLHLFHKCFERIESFYHLVPNASVQLNSLSIDSDFYASFLKSLNLSKLETVGVRHCPNAYGVAISGASGWKITYSGDTMPCDYLVTLGRGSDVLIHEATMEDELKDEAQLKMHSTTAEAIDIGVRMQAKFILLTHFSQRYSRLPKIDGGLAKNVGIAFDSMSVRLSDLPRIPLIYPALKTMFAEHYEEMEQKTAKKIRKREKAKAAVL